MYIYTYIYVYFLFLCVHEYLVYGGFQILGYADYAFTSIFTVEILLKVRKLHTSIHQLTPVHTGLYQFTPVHTSTPIYYHVCHLSSVPCVLTLVSFQYHVY